MPLLALQIDIRGVTALVVDVTAKSRLLGTATVPLSDDADKLAASLKASLGKALSGRVELAVALGPDQARVRRLAVPPVPEEELPTIIAMQAARDAAVGVDDLVADFLPSAAAQPADEPSTLLVASANEAVVEYWRDVAEALGGKLVAAVPRPLATLVLNNAAEVVATVAGDTIDFATRIDGMPYLLRSARAGAASGDRELRRTLLALNEVASDTDRLLVAASEPTLSPGATLIDWTEVGSGLKADAGSMASLREASAACGLAIGAARGETPVLNLAEPRKPPVPETGRRLQVLLAATAATVLLAGGWMAYERVASLDRQIADKEAEIREASKAVEAFDPYRERVATLDAWRQSDVTWLDEFERLGRKLRPEPLSSKDFPAENDLRVTQLVATSVLGGDEPGGRIDLVAQARSTSTSELEGRLRDQLHPVQPISTSETPAQDAYKYKYNVLLRAPAEVDEAEALEASEANPEADIEEQSEEAESPATAADEPTVESDSAASTEAAE